jgi:hypothetical protein
MKKTILSWILIGCTLSSFAIFGAGEAGLLEQAKLYLFDKQWDRALSVLNEFVEHFPKSNHFPLAILYKGKCLEEKKMYKKSLLSYMLFLDISSNASLKEEVTITIIDLYFNLYQKKEKSYLKRIIPYLKSKNRTVKFYSALKLSYIKDKKVAFMAVPVLKQMIKNVDDEELRDRAKIALMRIDPDLLNEIADDRGPEATLLHIQVYDKKLKKITFSLSIPFMLGKLALESIPEKEKASLKKEGYDLDRIMKKLMKKGDILRADSEDSVFKIWIE